MSIIYGTNTVRASLEANNLIKVYAAKDYKNSSLLDQIKAKNIEISYLDRDGLNNLTKSNFHQGIAAKIKDIYPVGLEEIIHIAKKKINPIIVVLDELSDPHNLGAILRSADAFDVSGVVYKKRGSVHLNETVAKVSTGAINFVKCSEVNNLTQALVRLKKEGFWVVGMDGEAKMGFKDLPKNTPLVLVVGSEGFGISRLVKENCDYMVKIPMLGRVNCLNASVACAIGLYALRND